MSTLVINHCDLDAVGCKIVLDYYKFPYDKMLSVNYGDITIDTAEVYKYDKIICTDFSLPTAIVQKLLDLGKTVEIYDHHDYDNDDLTKGLLTLTHANYKLCHRTDVCGTKIVVDEFGNKRIRLAKVFVEFISLVNAYDLYDKKSPLWEDAQNCNRVLWGCLNWNNEGVEKFGFICSYWMNKLKTDDSWHWTDFEQQKIKKAIDIENNEYKNALGTYRNYFDMKGVKYGVAIASKKISIIASKLLEKNNDIQYIIMMNTYKNIWGKISVRSREEGSVDCTNFLECHGHVNACGGDLAPDVAKSIYEGKSLTYKN